MRRYEWRKSLPLLIQCMLSILMLSLILSSLLLLSKLSSFVRVSFTTLPSVCEVFLGPKCLFIACNLIVFLLVGELKLSNGFQTLDIYEEYANQYNTSMKLVVDKGEEKYLRMEINLSEEEKKVRDEDEEKEEEEEEEEVFEDLEGEELRKRVEDFIAKVNMQRRLEATMLVSCG